MSTHSLLSLVNEIKCEELKEFFYDQKSLNRVLSLFKLPIYTPENGWFLDSKGDIK